MPFYLTDASAIVDARQWFRFALRNSMPDQTALKSLTQSIDRLAPDFTDLSDRIWDFAELKFDEFKSAELLVQTLKQHGFAVEQGNAGMETAFIGQYGSGNPIIAFLGEYDALAGMSQLAALMSRVRANRCQWSRLWP